MRSARVVLRDREQRAAIQIDDGIIRRVAAYDDVPEGAELVDAGALVVSPGIVDTHVHVNDPGRAEWEGFDTATRAAAAGGVTTIVDMPLNCVPATTSVQSLEAKREAARGRCHVDVAFWGGVVPGNASEIEPLVEAGVRGFKCFLVPSGVDEFPHVAEADLRQAMPVIARRGVPLLAHAEILPPPPRPTAGAPPFGDSPSGRPAPGAPQSYRTYLATRPPQAEVQAVRLMIRLAREFAARTHIVHVACAEGVDEIAGAKGERVPITGETCPHYLTFSAEEIRDGATEFKCAPPIREARHRQALWRGLTSNMLDLVVSDHSPAPPSLKCPGDFVRAWGGIASLELSLAATWTAAGQPSTCDMARWMSEAPARLAGLADRKGRIAPGFDADLVVWDPDSEMTVEPGRLEQRHKLTPYAGRRLRGRVTATFLRGERVWDGCALVSAGRGRLL